jgi:aquaporin Z
VARGVAEPGDGWSTIAVLTAEVVVVALLLVVSFALLSRRSTLRSAALVVPAVLALAVWTFARRTGAGFNPARILGPDLAAGRFPAIGAYLVGPLVGTVLASIAWTRLVGRSPLTAKLDHHPRYRCFFRRCRLHPPRI